MSHKLHITADFVRRHNRDEIRSANLALISGRQMHRINACIFLVAITKRHPD